MKFFKILSIVLFLFLVTVGVFYFLLGRVVEPSEIGIRQNQRSIPGFLKAGYEEKGLEPGLYWQIPMVSRVVTIPRTFQFIYFRPNLKDSKISNSQMIDIKGEVFEALPNGSTGSSLRIPTADGSIVATNITMILRFFESPGEFVSSVEKKAKDGIPLVSVISGKHSGPASLVTNYSLDNVSQIKQLIQRMDPMLKKSLSRLSTSDFYNPVRREGETLNAQKTLSRTLSQYGVEIWGTLINRYIYEKTAIDAQIFDKNLQEQNKKLNIALKNLAEEKAVTQEVLAKLDADILVLKAKQTSLAETIKSRGDLYEANKKAEGDLLVAKAEAEVATKKKEVLSTPQSKTYVAYQMVPLVGTLKGGVVGNLDPYDLDSWVERLIGKDNK